MRKWMLILVVACLACANIGCLAVVANETLETSSKRIGMVEGQMYIIDVEKNTATRVEIVQDRAEFTEVTEATSSEVVSASPQP
ncbi:MAG: hypothetical protein GY842_16290 [bacterium]|nr:hypothetical protein [bacterium]